VADNHMTTMVGNNERLERAADDDGSNKEGEGDKGDCDGNECGGWQRGQGQHGSLHWQQGWHATKRAMV
jgi:hypothetical protein